MIATVYLRTTGASQGSPNFADSTLNRPPRPGRPVLMFLILFMSGTRVSVETCVVKTKYLLSTRCMRIMQSQYVFARHDSQEKTASCTIIGAS